MLIDSTTDVPTAQRFVNSIGDKHPLLGEVRMHVFRGYTLFVLRDRQNVYALNVSRFGKRKTGVHGPFLNLAVNYTTEQFRRNGHASMLLDKVIALGAEAGCTRLKSLASSPEEVALHAKRGDTMWGYTEKGEILVDSLLMVYPGSIAYAPEGFKRPMTDNQIQVIINKTRKK